MADVATVPTEVDPADFIDSIDHERRRDEAKQLDALFRRATGATPVMWGPSIIGYGDYRTTYDSGREVHSLRSGFSPRKAKHSLYLMGGYCDPETGEKHADSLARLGKYSRGASCLYVNKLADIELDVLEEMVRNDWEGMKRRYPD
ncbi:DUF1801 domain-containing protein [Qipengyuania sp. MTN3-11]|uniref:DUF1801 domain-containing protein n=1 Tax=Qipengyuania sp. MTN3-11 TaxID=3056557 RepID=UPI0036F1A78E